MALSVAVVAVGMEGLKVLKAARLLFGHKHLIPPQRVVAVVVAAAIMDQVALVVMVDCTAAVAALVAPLLA
jgi:hypothetical protein